MWLTIKQNTDSKLSPFRIYLPLSDLYFWYGLLDRFARTVAQTMRFGPRKASFGDRITIKFHLRARIPPKPLISPRMPILYANRKVEIIDFGKAFPC